MLRAHAYSKDERKPSYFLTPVHSSNLITGILEMVLALIRMNR
jgi:hypothetical protein